MDPIAGLRIFKQCIVVIDFMLDVKIAGPSKVTYKGDPVVNKTINGPGKVERRTSEGA